MLWIVVIVRCVNIIWNILQALTLLIQSNTIRYDHWFYYYYYYRRFCVYMEIRLLHNHMYKEYAVHQGNCQTHDKLSHIKYKCRCRESINFANKRNWPNQHYCSESQRLNKDSQLIKLYITHMAIYDLNACTCKLLIVHCSLR